jgi:hypothetical protein
VVDELIEALGCPVVAREGEAEGSPLSSLKHIQRKMEIV